MLASRTRVRLHKSPVRAETTYARFRRFTRPAGVVVMLGLWFALLGLSASQHLHRCLHADAADPGHDCLVSSIAKGTALDVPPPLPSVQPIFVSLVLRQGEPEEFVRRIDLRLLPVRAPPASLVLL